MKKIAAISLLLATASFAAHADQTRWPKWYAGLHGSIPFVAEKEIERNNVNLGNLAFDSGWGAGGSLGYMPAGDPNTAWDAFRVELEFHHQENDVDSLGSVSGLQNGNMNVDSYMANIFYDIKNTTRLTPYIGAGAGWANMELNAPLVGINGDDTVIAYQFLTGFYYEPELIPLTRWGVGYRFFDSVNPSFGQGGATTTDVNYQTHSVEVGAQFRF